MAYMAWRAVAQRRGREVGAPPWLGLIGLGAILVAISLMATVAFQGDNRDKVYVPAQAHPGGGVTPGRFEAR